MGIFQDSDIAPAQDMHRPRPVMDISKILKEGEPILVQVSKEPISKKGQN